MLTVSVSASAPPEPVLPWSLVTICRVAAPLKSAVGEKLKPSRAALMSASVPVKVITASPTPSPVVKLRPVNWLSEIVPLVAVSVT